MSVLTISTVISYPALFVLIYIYIHTYNIIIAIEYLNLILKFHLLLIFLILLR